MGFVRNERKKLPENSNEIFNHCIRPIHLFHVDEGISQVDDSYMAQCYYMQQLHTHEKWHWVLWHRVPSYQTRIGNDFAKRFGVEAAQVFEVEDVGYIYPFIEHIFNRLKQKLLKRLATHITSCHHDLILSYLKLDTFAHERLYYWLKHNVYPMLD